MYLSFRIIYLLYTIWYYYMQEAKMFQILRYILLHNKNNSIQFPGKSTWWQAARTISLFPSIAGCVKKPLALGSLNIWTFVLFMYTI